MSTIPEPIKKPEIKYTQIFINNEWVNSESGKVFPNFNSTNGKKICDVQEGDKADVDKAVAAAKEAFKLGSVWRTMDASTRGTLLFKLAELMERDVAYLSSLETLENAKPYKTSFESMMFSIKIIKYYAGWADKEHGKTIPVDGNFFCYTRHEPVGICGQILGSNYPTGMYRKIGPALAMGNVVILKPAAQTPLTVLYGAQLCKEAGFPAGVINVIPGYGQTAGKAIAEHTGIDKVFYSGCTEVGQLVMQAAGKSNAKRIILEMGGKSPNVIFADADLDSAVELAHQAVNNYMGQSRAAGSRTFIQEDIYDIFVKKSVERAKKRILGDPMNLDTDSGPQINEKWFKKVLDYIKKGQEEGATLECGGKPIGDEGHFIEPTVFSNVTDSMTIAKEEIFGPVQQLIKFKDMDEVIERANNTCFGLSAAVFTSDINKAMTFAQGVRAGTVWVNCYYAIKSQAPFGGFKMSGIGRELGEYALREYTEIKSVVIKIPQKNS